MLSLKAGGVGLNVTAANHVIHDDRWWNPPSRIRPPTRPPDRPASRRGRALFWQAGPALVGLHLDPTIPGVPDAAIRSLGGIDREVAGTSVVARLTPAYDAITTGARARLLDDGQPG